MQYIFLCIFIFFNNLNSTDAWLNHKLDVAIAKIDAKLPIYREQIKGDIKELLEKELVPLAEDIPKHILTGLKKQQEEHKELLKVESKFRDFERIYTAQETHKKKLVENFKNFIFKKKSEDQSFFLSKEKNLFPNYIKDDSVSNDEKMNYFNKEFQKSLRACQYVISKIVKPPIKSNLEYPIILNQSIFLEENFFLFFVESIMQDIPIGINQTNTLNALSDYFDNPLNLIDFQYNDIKDKIISFIENPIAAIKENKVSLLNQQSNPGNVGQIDVFKNIISNIDNYSTENDKKELTDKDKNNIYFLIIILSTYLQDTFGRNIKSRMEYDKDSSLLDSEDKIKLKELKKNLPPMHKLDEKKIESIEDIIESKKKGIDPYVLETMDSIYWPDWSEPERHSTIPLVKKAIKKNNDIKFRNKIIFGSLLTASFAAFLFSTRPAYQAGKKRIHSLSDHPFLLKIFNPFKNFLQNMIKFVKNEHSKRSSVRKGRHHYELLIYNSVMEYKLFLLGSLSLYYLGKNAFSITHGILKKTFGGVSYVLESAWNGISNVFGNNTYNNHPQQKKWSERFTEYSRKKILPNKKDLLPWEIQQLLLVDYERKITRFSLNPLEKLAQNINYFDDSYIIKQYLDRDQKGINPELDNIYLLAFVFFIELRKKYQKEEDFLIDLFVKQTSEESLKNTLYLLYYDHGKDAKTKDSEHPYNQNEKNLITHIKSSFEYLFFGKIISEDNYKKISEWFANPSATADDFLKKLQFDITKETKDLIKEVNLTS